MPADKPMSLLQEEVKQAEPQGMEEEKAPAPHIVNKKARKNKKKRAAQAAQLEEDENELLERIIR